MEPAVYHSTARRRDSRHGTAPLPFSAWQGGACSWRVGVLKADGTLDSLSGVTAISLRINSYGGTQPGAVSWVARTVAAADFITPTSADAVRAGTEWHAEVALAADEMLIPVADSGERQYWWEWRAETESGDVPLSAGVLVVRGSQTVGAAALNADLKSEAEARAAGDTALGQQTQALDGRQSATEGQVTTINTTLPTKANAADVSKERAPMQRPIVKHSGAVLTMEQNDLGAFVLGTHFADGSYTIPAGLGPTSDQLSAESQYFNNSPGRRSILGADGVTVIPEGIVIPARTSALFTRVDPDTWTVVAYGLSEAVSGTPVCTSIPVITGALILGQTLGFNRAEWEDEPDEVSIQWFRGQTAIAGATGLSYTLTQEDVGFTISVQEVATNGSGPTYVGSIDTALVDIGIWIDSVNGNDANSGVGEANAVKTPTRLMAVVGPDASGKNIVCVRGSEFFEQGTFAGSNFTIIAVGTGEKPKWNAADPILSFTKTPGRTNIYQANIQLPGNVKIEGNVWADGVPLRQVTSLNTLDTTPGRAYIADWTAAETILYVHAAGSLVPITGDGKAYTFSRRQHGLLLTGDNIKADGMWCANNAHQDGSMKFIGRGAKPWNCHFSGGCRHYLFVQASTDMRACTFASDGANWLEDPYGFNAVVCYQPLLSGETWSIRDTVFGDEQGSDVPSVGLTGPLQHGSTEGDLLELAEYIDCTWRRCSGIAALAAVLTRIIRPVFDRNYGGASWGDNGNSLLIEGATGSTNQLTSVSTGGTVICRDSVLDIPLPGATSSSVGVFRYNSGASDKIVTIEDSTFNILDGYTGTNNKLVHMTRGPVTLRRSQITPGICSMLDYVFDAGFGGGSATHAGENNVYPIGISFRLNGTTLPTLADLQLLGHDTTSTTAPMPATVASDNFNRANENLDVSTGWTLVSGTAATMGVVSNALNSIVATAVNSYYRRQVMASADHWVKFKVAAIPTGTSPFVALRAIDENNGLIIRVNTTSYQLSTLIAGTATLRINSSVQAPAIGDTIIVCVKGTRAWMYVYRSGAGLSGARLLGKAVELSAPTLAAATGVGIIRRSGPVTVFIDDFECGLIP